MKKFYESPLFEAVELIAHSEVLQASIAKGNDSTSGEGEAPARGGFALKKL